MLRVLVVEDSPYKANIAKSIAIENGLHDENIIVAECVQQAVSLLKNNSFSIMVLDMNLPIRKKGKAKSDAGISILKMLESEDLNVPTSVIGVTGYTNLNEQYSDFFETRDFILFDSKSSDKWEKALDNKLKWFIKEQRAHDKHSPDKVVVTVHGIRTAGKWQKKLEQQIAKIDPTIKAVPFEFNNISSVKLLNPISRRKIASNFSGQLFELMRKHPESEFYLFSHSFGTYLLAKALKNLASENSPKIKCVILAGSVLKRTFKWHKIRENLKINTIVNDCGVDDKVLLLSDIFGLGLGMAGRVGFDTFKSESVVNREHFGGHSFFEKNSKFYEKYWLPMIFETVNPTPIKVERNSAWESFLDSLKVIVWGGFLMLLFVYYYY